MKRILFIFFLYFWMPPVWSQNRIGLIAGGVYAKSNLTNQNQSGAFTSSTSFDKIYSYFGGIAYDIKVTSEFSIKSKLLYVNKGWTQTNNQRRDSTINIRALNIGTNSIPIEFISSKEKYQLSYLELPVCFTFYTPIGRSLLSFGVGPYISYGLHGRYRFKALHSSKYISSSVTVTVDSSGTQLLRNISIIKDTSGYLADSTALIRFSGQKNKKSVYTANRFDFGACLEASLEFRSGLCINASYTTGVANVIKEHYGAIQNRYRVVMLSLGYYIRKKSKHH